MENPTTLSTGFPVIGQAAAVQFGPHDRLFFPRVASRAVLRCERGGGDLLIDGTRHPFAPATIVILRWGHAIGYRPDPDDPFLVHGMHLIPWHRADAPVELSVPHDVRHALAEVPWRRDSRAAGREDLILSSDRERPELATLMRYAAQIWEAGIPDVAVAKALGVLALAELAAPPRTPPHEDPQHPAELRRLLAWIEAHLDRDFTVADLAAVAGRGATTVNRTFRRHLRTSPMNWVIERRIDRARQLLSRTHLTVAQVGRAIGMSDPYYFSRLFKERSGMSPSSWREHHSSP